MVLSVTCQQHIYFKKKLYSSFKQVTAKEKKLWLIINLVKYVKVSNQQFL